MVYGPLAHKKGLIWKLYAAAASVYIFSKMDMAFYGDLDRLTARDASAQEKMGDPIKNLATALRYAYYLRLDQRAYTRYRAALNDALPRLMDAARVYAEQQFNRCGRYPSRNFGVANRNFEGSLEAIELVKHLGDFALTLKTGEASAAILDAYKKISDAKSALEGLRRAGLSFKASGVHGRPAP